jgi:subtilisin family serine protease
MHYRKRPAALIVVVSLCAGVGTSVPAASPQTGPGRQSSAEFVEAELLVQYEPLTEETHRAAARAVVRGNIVRRFSHLGIERLRLPRTTNPVAAARALRGKPHVRAVQPNYRRTIAAQQQPDDTYWLDGSMWALKKIGADSAWSTFGAGNTTVVIANIDTGVNYTHPDLAGNIWRNPGEIPGNGVDDEGNGYVDDVYGIDTANGDSDPFDDHWHGTHTSGTAGAVANNGVGIAGVSWNVRILPCKFMDGSGVGTDAAAIECFNYVVDQKARGVNLRVTSNSWGRPRGADFAPILINAIDATGAAGVLNVFAAGNAGTNNDLLPYDPASFPSASIVSVAASDEMSPNDRVMWSNFGGASVHLAAPGVNILSAFHDWYAPQSGTSMAAAHVAGAAAVLFAHRPELTVQGAKEILTSSVDVTSELTGAVVAGGTLNLYRALQRLTGGNPAATLPSAFIGSPHAVPGLIEAEHFDSGEAGAAYFDSSSGNTGGVYRDTDVDLEPSADTGGGYNVGWMAAGEWLQYTVQVGAAGEHLLELRVAAEGPGGTLHVDVDGIVKSGTVVIPDTGGWQQWQTISTNLWLDAGVHRLRVVVDEAGPWGIVGNLNYLRISEVTAEPVTNFSGPGEPELTIEAEDFDASGAGATYGDTSLGNDGGEYRQTDVDIERSFDAGGGYNVGWIAAGEWLQYTIDVASEGLHAVEVRLASPGGGGRFHLEIDGADRTGPLTVPTTGGWQLWQSLTVDVWLPAGKQRVRIVFDSEGVDGAVGNVNYIRLKPM